MVQFDASPGQGDGPWVESDDGSWGQMQGAMGGGGMPSRDDLDQMARARMSGGDSGGYPSQNVGPIMSRAQVAQMLGGQGGQMGGQSREADLDQMLGGLFGGGGGQRPPPGRSREAELDQALSGMFGGGVIVSGGDGARMRSRSTMMGPDVVIQSGGWGPGGGFQSTRRSGMPGSSMPVQVFSDLFPGPVAGGGQMQMMQMQHAQPFDSPDPMVMNMLQGLGQSFQSEMLPAIHRAAAASGLGSPDSCLADVKAKCKDSKSQLHCLGQNADTISEQCKKDVGKSVPFLCGSQIDRWCDGLEKGILVCLGEHIDELQSSGQKDCADAVTATHQVIAKVMTQKATVKDAQTGTDKVHAPQPSPGVLATAAKLLQTPAAPASAALFKSLLGDASADVMSKAAVNNNDRRWVFAVIGVVVLYLLTCTDAGRSLFSRKTQNSMKAFSVQKAFGGESARTLTGGVELPKPVDMYGCTDDI